MKNHRDRNREGPATENYRELDALVLAEVEALQQGHSKKRSEGARPTRKGGASSNVIFKERWAQSQEPNVGTSADMTAELDADREAPEFDSAPLDESPSDLEFDEGAEPVEAELFTLEERTFIRRTSEWLQPRENKDLIMSRIWALLTESVPEGFFEAETDASAEEPSGSTSEAGGTTDSVDDSGDSTEESDKG